MPQIQEIPLDKVPLKIQQLAANAMQEVPYNQVPLEVRQKAETLSQEVPEDQVPPAIRQRTSEQAASNRSVWEKIKDPFNRASMPPVEEQKTMAHEKIALLKRYDAGEKSQELEKARADYANKWGVEIITNQESRQAAKEVASEAITESPKTAVELGAKLLSGAAWGWKKPVEVAAKHGFKGRVASGPAKLSGGLLRTVGLMGVSSAVGSAVAPHIPGAQTAATWLGEKSLLAGKAFSKATQAIPAGGAFWSADETGNQAVKYLNKELKFTRANIIKSGGDILEAGGLGSAIAVANILPYAPVRIPVAMLTRFGVEKVRAKGAPLDMQAKIKIGLQGVMATRTGTALTGQDISAHNKALMRTASQFLPPKFFALPIPEQEAFLDQTIKAMETMPISKAIPEAMRALKLDAVDVTTPDALRNIDDTSNAIKQATVEDFDPSLFNKELISEGQSKAWKGQNYRSKMAGVNKADLWKQYMHNLNRPEAKFDNMEIFKTGSAYAKNILTKTFVENNIDVEKFESAFQDKFNRSFNIDSPKDVSQGLQWVKDGMHLKIYIDQPLEEILDPSLYRETLKINPSVFRQSIPKATIEGEVVPIKTVPIADEISGQPLDVRLPETKYPFLERDVIPKTKEFYGGVKKSTDWLKNTFNPLGKVKVSDQDIFFKHIGKYRHDKDMFFARGDATKSRLDARGDEKNLSWANKFENNRLDLMDTEELALAKHYKEFSEHLYGIVSQYKGINHLDNWLTHVYNKINGTDLEAPTTKEGFQRMKGSFEYKRVHSDLQSAIDTGLNPVINIEDAARIKYSEAIKFKMTQDLFTELQPKGGMDYFTKGNVPEGFVPIEEPIMKVYFPNHGAVGRGEHLYAQEDLARIINNHLSSDWLGKTAIGKGWQWTNRQMNLFNLSLSGFHFSNTNLHAAGQKFGEGMQDIVRGRPLQGVKNMLASPVAGPVKFVEGKRLINKMMAGNDPEAIKMAEDLYMGGGRTITPRDFNSRVAKFNTELKNKNYAGAIFRAPTALLEASLQPLMKHYIPAIKVSAFNESYKRGLEFYGDKIDAGLMTEGEVARMTWNQQDYLYGKMSKDNLFWDKTTEAAMEAFVRSTTYTLGTGKIFGGAAVDTSKIVKNLLTGNVKDIKFTDEQASAAGIMTLTAMLGGAYQYLHTGEEPQEFKDFYFPKNGQVDESGSPRRTKIMGYGTETIAWVRHPLRTAKHKLSPMFNAMAELITNEDYYGDMVRNPNAGILKQIYQTLKWGVGKFEPWSIKQARKDIEHDAPLLSRIEAATGLAQAPREWRQTQTEKNIFDLYKKQSGIDVRLTPEKRDIQKRKSAAMRELKKGESGEFIKLVSEGEIKNPLGWVSERLVPYPQGIFKRLTPDGKISALRGMNGKELIRYLPLVKDEKIVNMFTAKAR